MELTSRTSIPSAPRGMLFLLKSVFCQISGFNVIFLCLNHFLDENDHISLSRNRRPWSYVSSLSYLPNTPLGFDLVVMNCVTY